MIIKRDDAFRVVGELVNPTGPLGTCMFVGVPINDDKITGWIVTASHVAALTNENTQIIISQDDRIAKKAPLITFGPPDRWAHHLEGDISVLNIVFTEENEKLLSGRLFPYDHFNLERTPVSRDIELTSIGFPNGLGADGYFSPFTFRSHASSGFVTLPRADTRTQSVFFCLENPSVGGYSGCPVFDLGYSFDGTMLTSREATRCYGIMHGTMIDNTGGKIAMVTPSFYLKDIIDRLLFNTEQ